MIRHTLLTILLAIGLSFPAYACIAAAPGQCPMQEQVTIAVNFNLKAKSFAEAKKMFDEQMVKIDEFGKQQKIEKLMLQNLNYNISSQPEYTNGVIDGYTYQLSGSASYMMDNADAAFKFAEFLTSQKIQVNLNSNSYRNGNCVPSTLSK